MGGREAAHYARTNKPSWMVLSCSCLWVQAYRDNRSLTGRHTILRETSQMTRYIYMKKKKYKTTKYQTNIRSIIWCRCVIKNDRSLRGGGWSQTEAGKNRPLSGVARKASLVLLHLIRDRRKKIINGCSRDESLAWTELLIDSTGTWGLNAARVWNVTDKVQTLKMFLLISLGVRVWIFFTQIHVGGLQAVGVRNVLVDCVQDFLLHLADGVTVEDLHLDLRAFLVLWVDTVNHL